MADHPDSVVSWKIMINWNADLGAKAASDTIAASDSTSLFILSEDADGHGFLFDDAERFVFNISGVRPVSGMKSSSAKSKGDIKRISGDACGYGRLSGNSAEGVTFAEITEGMVRFIADGEVPEEPVEIEIGISGVNNGFLNGTARVVVKPYKCPTIGILDRHLEPTGELQIALWDHAYEPNGNVVPDFISPDTRCFYVRVSDDRRNVDKNKKDTLTVFIGTEAPAPWASDNYHPVTLEENGNDTGVFLSEAQMLMSPDLDNVVDTDDGYKAYSKFAGHRVIDDKRNDRTHQCYPGGRVIAKYYSTSGEMAAEAVVPALKQLRIKQIILIEPYNDTGYYVSGVRIEGEKGKFDYADLNNNGLHDPGEPSEEYLDISAKITNYYLGDSKEIILFGDGRGAVATNHFINKQVRRANIGWAQAGIGIDTNESVIKLTENPGSAINYDILQDGTFDPRKDVQILYNEYKDNLISRTDIAYVFYTAPLTDDNTDTRTYGVALHPGLSGYTGSHYHCYVNGCAHLGLRTLAHELGHLMSLEGDEGYRNPHWFFPRESLPMRESLDITVEYARRLPQEIIDKAITNSDLF